MPMTNGECSYTPIEMVGARVPIHLGTAISIDCPRVPRRAVSMAMNSPDISRFCRKAEYFAASCQPNWPMKSHCTA